MNRLRAAISFLTILPMGKSVTFAPPAMIPMFPVVGLIIGILLALFDQLAMRIFPNPAGAVLDVVFLIVITGALHVDGLGDAADGIFSHRSRERTMEIMKDSRIGTMGLVAIVCMLAMKSSSLAMMESHQFTALMIIPAYARASAIFGIRYLKYGRPEGGTGIDFFKSPLPFSALGWFLLPVLLSALLGLKCLLINATFVVTVAGILFFYKSKLNCITGDMLGAMIETTEAVLFLAMTLGTGF